jgi:hypothetical protein
MGLKKPRIEVYSPDEAMALLDQKTHDELKQHELLKIKLAAKNRKILKTTDLSIAACGLSHSEANRAMKILRSEDLSNLDLDDSLDCSRGIITIDNRNIFWTLDCQDEATLRARSECTSVIVSFLPLKMLKSN